MIMDGGSTALRKFLKKTERDKEARREYRANKSMQADVNDIYMLDIIREEIKNGDKRLQ
jgi:hypothetical protein